MNTKIYYFSGTGSTFYVAKELQKRIKDSKLIPIVSLLKQEIIGIHGETVGFVFPLHGMTVPIPVKIFLKKIKLKSVEYIFSIATRGGTKCFAFKKINQILKRNRKCLDSTFMLTMINKKPVWQKNVKCYLCYTCLNYCPEQAVQIKSKIYMKSYTDKNGRYPHPFATIKDITGQK